MRKTSILVIYTGGTIGMVKDPKSGSLKPCSYDELIRQVPDLQKLNYQIDYHSFEPLVDSSNMSPDIWLRLAEKIEENYRKYDGFVVLHGSDTMSYTASALSFLFENLDKPIVITGSQLPLGIIRTDGKENFITAIEIAGAARNGKPVLAEVCIYFEYKLYRGNRTYKYNAENFNAFRSTNYPLLAEAGVRISYNDNAIMKPGGGITFAYKNMDNNVAVLKMYPGINEATINSILNTEGVKAIVLESYGSGNAITDTWFINTLKDAINRGVIVYNVTQCRGGSVELGKYETSEKLKEIGVISGYDITFEAAVCKLMFLLGNKNTKKEVEALLETPMRGEMTIR